MGAWWSIRNRMVVLSLAAATAILALGGIQYFAADAVQSKTGEAAELKDAIAVVSEARLENVGMLLAAMDSLVDRAEGGIQPERAKTIDAAVAYVNAHLDEIVVLGNRAGANGVTGTLKADFAALARAIQTDLRVAIENGADDRQLAKIDDVIDDAGERFERALTSIDERAHELLAAKLAEADATVESSLTQAIATSLVALLVLIALATVITLSVVRGLGGLSAAMKRLAAGDLEAEVPFAGKADELGAMAEAVLVFRENGREVRRLQAEREAQRARASEERRTAMATLSGEFDASVKVVVRDVSGAATEMGGTSRQLVDIANLAVEETNTVASMSEQTNAAVQSVATATEELSSSIAEINQRLAESVRITKQATATAAATSEQVRTLSEAAERIGEVVNLIQNIAGQTNLLALNATIEAARAGEAGKGFAVVASEVKTLATETAQATEDIAAQISAIQAATNDAVAAIAKISGTTKEIDSITSSIAASVEQQGAATQEISRSAQEAAATVQQTVDTIRKVSRRLDETGKSVRDVSESATRLTGRFSSLNDEVDTFLDRIRAA